MVAIPVGVSFLAYVPFRLLATQLNTITYSTSNNFYHPLAIVTWPGYAAVVALGIALLTERLHLHLIWRLLSAWLGCGTIFLTEVLDDWANLHDTGRHGLDRWFTNSAEISTDQISASLVEPIYIGTWIATTILLIVVRKRRKFSIRHLLILTIVVAISIPAAPWLTNYFRLTGRNTDDPVEAAENIPDSEFLKTQRPSQTARE